MASLRAIREIHVRHTSEGAEKVSRELDQQAAANEKLAKSGEVVATVTEKVARRQLSAEGAYEKFRAANDRAYQAQQRFRQGQEVLDRAFEQGIVLQGDYDRQLDLLRTRTLRASGANDNYRQSLVQSERAMDRFRHSIGLTDDRMGRMQAGFTGAMATLGSYRMALAGIAGVVSIGGTFAVSGIVETAAQFQKLEASLKTVTGSATAAKGAMALIQDFAAETPFDLQQVTEAYIRLKSLGLDPSREALESYGNTASAMGKPIMQMIEAVADAATGENERLKEFGIRAAKEGENVAFTFQGVTTTVGNSAAEIEGYLRGIGQVQFAGAMLEQMETLPGALSNLQDAVATFQNQIGQGGLSSAVEDSARSLSGFLSANEDLARVIGSEMGRAIRDLNQVVSDLASAANWAASEVDLFGREISDGFAAVASVANHFAGRVSGLFASITGASSQAALLLPSGWNEAVREIHDTIAGGVQRMVRTFAAIPAAGHAAREALFGNSFSDVFAAEQQRFVDAVNGAGSALGDALGFHVTLDEVVISTRDAANATADLRSNFAALAPTAADATAAIESGMAKANREAVKAAEAYAEQLRSMDSATEAMQHQIDALDMTEGASATLPFKVVNFADAAEAAEQEPVQ